MDHKVILKDKDQEKTCFQSLARLWNGSFCVLFINFGKKEMISRRSQYVSCKYGNFKIIYDETEV